MNRLFCMLILIFLTSCSTYRFKTVSGHYRTKGGFEWGSSISLDKDSTFTYKWQSGLIFGKTTGKWNIKGNNLFLNSDLQPQPDTIPDYHLIETENYNTNSLIIDLLWPDSLSELLGATGLMFLKGDIIDRQISDTNGSMKFKNKDADSIKISFIGLKDIVLKNINNDYYKIATINKEEMYEFFTNEIWKIRGEFLIDKSKNDYYYEKRFYKVE